MSPTLNGSSAIQLFECGDAIETNSRIILNFYMGTATHTCLSPPTHQVILCKVPWVLLHMSLYDVLLVRVGQHCEGHIVTGFLFISVGDGEGEAVGAISQVG